MLNKYRIGNDISVIWTLFDAVGSPVNLEDRNIALELHVGSHIIPITDFDIEDNQVSFVFYGASQVYTGTYSVCLREASGNLSILTIDEFKIFVLVDHSWESTNELSTSFEVSFGSVLTGVLGPNQGVPGAAAGFGTIDAEIDSGTGTPSVQVTTSGPDTAKNIHFVFSGLKGAPGTTGNPAGFGTVTASVDNTTGTPSVQVSTSGPDTAKNIAFAFSGLKGAPGQGGGGGGASDPTGFLSALTYDQSTSTWTLNGNLVCVGEVTAGESSE